MSTTATHAIKRRVCNEITTLCGKSGFVKPNDQTNVELDTVIGGILTLVDQGRMPTCKSCLKSLK